MREGEDTKHFVTVMQFHLVLQIGCTDRQIDDYYHYNVEYNNAPLSQ